MRHGYGFVQFACEDEAQKALKDGASKFLRGYQLGKLWAAITGMNQFLL